MILNYKNSSIVWEETKIISTNDIFEILKKLIEQNKNSLVISPLSKIKDIFDIKANSPFISYLSKFLEAPLFNENNIFNLECKINEEFNTILEADLNVMKLLKNIFAFKEDYVTSEILINFLKNLLPYFGGVSLIVFGFDNCYQEILKYLTNYGESVYITSNLHSLKLTRNLFELIVFDFSNELIEIVDYNIFKTFLESICNIHLSDNQISNFFLSKSSENDDFSAFQIQNALKKM